MTVKSTKWATIIGTVLLCFGVFYLGQNHYLTDPEKMQILLMETGMLAPVVFMMIQIISECWYLDQSLDLYIIILDF